LANMEQLENARTLITVAQSMMVAGKGLLAMDESTGTCDRRFASLGIAQTAQARRAYRDLLVTTPGLGGFISGAILYDETIRQQTLDGRPFVAALNSAGIIPGIKVDLGTSELAGHPAERVTEGLDGLRKRLQDYSAMGARFAKWRAVLAIGKGMPSPACIEVNAHALARYAALCQEAGVVPIVEPEVLMDGDHTMARCAAVTQEVLHRVFDQLHVHGVLLEAMILKPNMVLPGLACPVQESVQEVATATMQCLLRAVPAAVAGIAFLSGGQSGDLASARLNTMRASPGPAVAGVPWPLTFSFGRALQEPALAVWSGMSENRTAAQQALLRRARENGAAQRGDYCPGMESA
jgi:fructose-bisphosphate aldolase, class I